MAKKLVNFSRPVYTKGMTKEEKAKADDDHTIWLVKEIVKSSPEMFGKPSDEEIDKIMNEALSDDFIDEEE